MGGRVGSRHGIASTSRRTEVITQRLTALTASLSETTRRTEPDFVQLASDLKALYGFAAELGRATSSHLNVVRGALQSSRLTGSDGLAERSLAKLQGGIAKATRSLDALSAVAGDLGSLQSHGQQMERIAMFLKASGCNFAVESARSAACLEAFGSFVEQLRQLAEKIKALGWAIQNQSAVTQEELGKFHRAISADLGKLRQLAQQSDATVRQTSGQMQQLLDSAWSALQQAETHARQITRHADDAVFHLQFGDILRQKLEHVISALADTSETLANWEPSERGRAGGILAIQAGQLELIESEIHATRTQLADAFSGLANETNQVLSHVRTIENGSSTVGANQNIFESLKTDLLALNNLQTQGHQVCCQAHATSRQAIDASARLALHLDQVREINREMHLQALNAIIKTTLLGEEGQTLGVLSMHVHTVFEESNGLVNETVCVLQAVTAQTADSEAFATDETSSSKSELQSGLDQLSRVHGEFRETVSSAVSIAHQQEARLGDARRRLDFLSDLAGQIAVLRREIVALHETLPKIGACDDEPAGSLAGRYTMESEREVHRRLVGQTRETAPATASSDCTSTTSAVAIGMLRPPSANAFASGQASGDTADPNPGEADGGSSALTAKDDSSVGDNFELF